MNQIDPKINQIAAKYNIDIKGLAGSTADCARAIANLINARCDIGIAKQEVTEKRTILPAERKRIRADVDLDIEILMKLTVQAVAGVKNAISGETQPIPVPKPMVKPQASAETSTIETAGSAGAAAAKPVEEEAGSFERMLPDIIGRIASFSPFSERADTLHGIAAAAGQKVSLQTAQISNTGNEFASLQEAIDTWVTIPEPDADVLDALMRSLGIQASYSPTDLSSLRLHAASEAHLTQLMRFFAVRFPNIEALDLVFHPVSPEAIRALGQLKHLRSFEVRHATLGDAHLAAIATLKSLTRLSFGVGSQATAAGYRHLQELPELRSLSLPNTRGDLAFLRGLPQMVHLELANCGLTDDHLAHLEPLTELKQLTLSLNPQITDKGIQDHLCHMTKMETLLVDGTACTKGGVEVLRFLQGRDT